MKIYLMYTNRNPFFKRYSVFKTFNIVWITGVIEH